MAATESFDCPHCKRVTVLPNVPRRLTCVCGLCHAILDVSQSSPQWKQLSSKQALSHIPLPLGASGTIDGIGIRVVGWIRYKNMDSSEEWSWEEWCLSAKDGMEYWLSYSPDEGFYFLQKLYQEKTTQYSSSQPLVIPGMSQTAPVPLQSAYASTAATSVCCVDAMAGVFADHIQSGDRCTYSHTTIEGKLLSFEYSDELIEVFEGTPLTKSTIGKAFGIKALQLKMLLGAFTRPTFPIVPDQSGRLSLSAGDDVEGGLSIEERQGGGLSITREK